MNETKNGNAVNRAKPYQLVLFPLNNGATNVYYVLVLSYIATFGSKVLALSMIFASVMVTGMRLFDAVTDPIIGALMDRTNGKFGKFRPFMVIGNLIMAVSILALYCLTPLIPDTMMWARYAMFVALYAVWVIGYTFQTSCTRSGQTVLTNDPKQRPLFTIFNTVGSLLGMGAMQFFAPILAKNYEGGYGSAGFFRMLAPVGIVISILLTLLAVVGIWEKDQPKYFGIGGEKIEKLKVSEYVQIIKENKPMQRLMVAGAGCKLALSIATNTTVLCMLYGCMMGNYDGLYLPMMVLGYVFSVPFFLLTVRTSQKKGQKASLMRYVSVALVCYVGVFVLLLLWKQDSAAFSLSLLGEGGLSINLYTVLFILLFGIGYGAYYATADMPIPMVADCSDYETYQSGKYIPGIMGTLFSLVDKLVSSLSATVVGVAVSFIGLESLPTQYDPYTPGMNVVVIVLFCVIPMVAWAATLIAMKGYSLTGEKMKEIQAVNACRRDAVANGMSMEDAMRNYVKMEDVPDSYK
ncbi:Na+/melibiose symporter [Gemmiger formicilis]|jgi:Na+/melibiose symporter-like transporter|uniref:Na+/melibiose symporter n=1 Tax=Gemmiger formicilis TaxID=745368 RepID=A0A1T4Y4D7_9FIRM|nr:MFS transporter [Gemmiger formicilis]SKA96667.1 Na+/melibiose symporter [Gemmiger formicilis]